MEVSFGALCDDFYVSSRLFLKLELTFDRETVLHFFDRIRREYPGMSKMRRREDGVLVLEEEPSDSEARRWIRLGDSSLRFGFFGPSDLQHVRRFGGLILDQAPYHLTFSELDYDHLEVVYGFDLEYRGNHDQLVAEALYTDHPLARLFMYDDDNHVIDCQPYFGMSLTTDCDIQAYVEVKSRTTSFEVRTNEYETQPLSVFLTLRKYWGFSEPQDLASSFSQLCDLADELAANKVVPMLVNPLAQAIASRP